MFLKFGRDQNFGIGYFTNKCEIYVEFGLTGKFKLSMIYVVANGKTALISEIPYRTAKL